LLLCSFFLFLHRTSQKHKTNCPRIWINPTTQPQQPLQHSTMLNATSFRIILTALLLDLINSTIRQKSPPKDLPSTKDAADHRSLTTTSYAFSLMRCKGPCMDDSDCAIGLTCFQRTGSEPVPGCVGTGSSGTSYCIDTAASIVVTPGGSSSSSTPAATPPPAGAGGSFSTATGGDVVGPPDLVELGVNGEPAFFYPLQRCEGACHNDTDCVAGLLCFDRVDRELVPGCFGDGISGTNYCIAAADLGSSSSSSSSSGSSPPATTNAPPQLPPPPPAPTPTPTAAIVPVLPAAAPTLSPITVIVPVLPTAPTSNILRDGNSIPPLGRCEGECFHDNDCDGDYLHCFHRSGIEAVPGCAGEGVFGRGYCAQIVLDSSTPGSVLYQPGQATVFQNGVQFSQGLLSRVIAVSGSPVKYYDTTTGGSSYSTVAFHDLPDGAAVFTKNGTDGWVYVSNSEALDGGVGALYFNSQGQVTGYTTLLSGTTRNCGCGKSFWNTFLSCEEYDSGRIWHVDPWGTSFQPHVTVIGSEPAAYESVAYDNRNVFNPHFFATIE
jgi:Bacterial protein of unknown function (DUF839)